MEDIKKRAVVLIAGLLLLSGSNSHPDFWTEDPEVRGMKVGKEELKQLLDALSKEFEKLSPRVIRPAEG